MKKKSKNIKSYVSKFNASITRMEKANPDIAGNLPHRYDAELIKKTYTPSEIKQFYKDVDRWFNVPGQRTIVWYGGFAMTKFEKRNIQREESKINTIREKVKQDTKIRNPEGFEDIFQKIDAEKTARKIIEQERRGEISSASNAWYNFVNKLSRESKQEYYEKAFARYRQNYYQSLYENLSLPDALDIINLISDSKMTDYDLFTLTQSDDLTTIEFIYGKNEEEYIADRVKTHVQNFIDKELKIREHIQKIKK